VRLTDVNQPKNTFRTPEQIGAAAGTVTHADGEAETGILVQICHSPG